MRNVTRGRKDCLLEQGEIDFAKHLSKMSKLENKILYIEQQYHEEKAIEDAKKNFEFVSQLLYPDANATGTSSASAGTDKAPSANNFTNKSIVLK